MARSIGHYAGGLPTKLIELVERAGKHNSRVPAAMPSPISANQVRSAPLRTISSRLSAKVRMRAAARRYVFT